MRKLTLALLTIIVAGAALIPTRPAVGAFPGTNGLIAYTAGLAAGTELCAVHPEGGNPYRLTNEAEDVHDAAWSPDGTELLFTVGTGEPQIKRMSASSLGAQTSTVTSGLAPAWSPDGTRIAFVRSGRIYTADPDGTDEAVIVDEGTYSTNPAWSPDGAEIAFDNDLRDNTVDNGGIYLVPSAGGEIRHLGDGFEPSWSPGGSEIAARDHNRAEAIVAIDVDTGETRTVIASDGRHFYNPAWSPGGEHIAFAGFPSGGSHDSEIWIVDADGGNLRRVTDSVEETFDPDWQPLLTPPMPTTARAVPCVSYPYKRSVSLHLNGHLVARGRVRTLDPQASCHRFVPVQIRKKRPSRDRVFYVRSRRAGRFKLRLPDRTGRYYATIAPDDRVECAADRSGTKSHRH